MDALSFFLLSTDLFGGGSGKISEEDSTRMLVEPKVKADIGLRHQKDLE